MDIYYTSVKSLHLWNDHTCVRKDPKGSRSCSVLRDHHIAVQKDYRTRSWEQRILHLPLCYSQEEWDKSLQNESETSEPIHNLYKIQDDHPKTDQGCHLPRSWAASLDIKSAYCHISKQGDTTVFSASDGKNSIY